MDLLHVPGKWRERNGYVPKETRVSIHHQRAKQARCDSDWHSTDLQATWIFVERISFGDDEVCKFYGLSGFKRASRYSRVYIRFNLTGILNAGCSFHTFLRIVIPWELISLRYPIQKLRILAYFCIELDRTSFHSRETAKV